MSLGKSNISSSRTKKKQQKVNWDPFPRKEKSLFAINITPCHMGLKNTSRTPWTQPSFNKMSKNCWVSHNHNPENASYNQWYVTQVSIVVNQSSHYTHIIQCIREHKKSIQFTKSNFFMLKNTQTAFKIPQIITTNNYQWTRNQSGEKSHWTVPHVIRLHNNAFSCLNYNKASTFLFPIFRFTE